jgi:glycosyltransferase involved in cell wall biosynthesis
MSGLPTVSVVLCAMNDERFIGETIESLLSQQYPRLQVHVQLSSRSTDNTRAVVERYPVQLAVGPDTGVPDAFNKGFHATNGEICIFQGADDPMLPGSIERLARTLVEHPEVGFVYADVDYIDAYSAPFYTLRGKPFDLDDLFWFNHVATQSVAMRRTAVEAVGLYRTGIINADWDLWLRLGARYKSLYLPEVLARYRVHSGSNSLNNLREMARSTVFVTETVLDEPYVANALRRGAPRALAGGYLWSALLYTLGDDRHAASRLICRATRAYPAAVFTRRWWMAIGALAVGSKGYARLRNRGRRPG